MKVSYDNQVDALYLQFSKKRPEGVVEISEGVSLDVATDGTIIGIEILDSSKKVDLTTFLSYQIDFSKDIPVFKEGIV